MDTLKRSSRVWESEVISNLDAMWDTIESNLAKDGKASVFVPLQKFLFNFLSKSIVGANPAADPKVAESGYAMLDRWLAVQLLPTINIGMDEPKEHMLCP